jgi:hypothetical protein
MELGGDLSGRRINNMRAFHAAELKQTHRTCGAFCMVILGEDHRSTHRAWYFRI